jgi:hypothetical protein
MAERKADFFVDPGLHRFFGAEAIRILITLGDSALAKYSIKRRFVSICHFTNTVNLSCWALLPSSLLSTATLSDGKFQPKSASFLLG